MILLVEGEREVARFEDTVAWPPFAKITYKGIPYVYDTNALDNRIYYTPGTTTGTITITGNRW
jgi:hypothetical protein